MHLKRNWDSATGGSRRRFGPFGPGTLVALLGAVGITIYCFANASQPTRMPAKTAIGNLPKPLWKPQPGDLLTKGELKLTPKQRRAILGIALDWKKRKSELEAAMATYVPRQGRLDQLQAQLGPYQTLSRQFESDRSEAWQRATHILTAQQRKVVTP